MASGGEPRVDESGLHSLNIYNTMSAIDSLSSGETEHTEPSESLWLEYDIV